MTTLQRASVLVCLMWAIPASSHHSGAMFDRDKDVAVTGIVKDWKWSNPHTWLVLSVPNGEGQLVEWNLEGASPQVLRGRGWARELMKPGDKVTVHIHPLRDGAEGGSIATVTTADGRTFK